jgi:cadmium resistance protein CadD (predicted permease)
MLLTVVMMVLCVLQCQSVADWFENNSKYLVPFLLLGLGMYILADRVLVDAIRGNSAK